VNNMSDIIGGFTVLMSVYRNDDLELFNKAVESVFVNTICPNAMILTVDGTVPVELANRIEYYESKYKIQVVRLSTNCGLANALNEGMRYVDTKWVIRADADDYNHPDRFEKLLERIKLQPDLSLLGSAIDEYDRSGELVARRNVPIDHADICQFLRRRNPFNHMAVAFRLDMVKTCGGYPNIHLKEDYALWASMISAGAITANVPDVLVDVTAGRDMYRRRGGPRYAKSEIQLQRHLVAKQIKSRTTALIDGIMRASVFLMPNTVRGLIYEKILRDNIKKTIMRKAIK